MKKQDIVNILIKLKQDAIIDKNNCKSDYAKALNDGIEIGYNVAIDLVSKIDSI